MQNPYQPPQPLQVGYYQAWPFAQARRTSGLAITSLILGILSLVGAGWLIAPPVLAVIFGHVAVNACNRDPLLDGKGMGIAGLVMGWITLAIFIAVIIFYGGVIAFLVAVGLANQH